MQHREKAAAPDLGSGEFVGGPRPRAGEAERVRPGKKGRKRARLATLVGLLDEDSPAILVAVQAELEEAGRAAVPALRRALRGENARVRARARRLLATWDRRAIMRRLFGFATTHADGGLDLERALLLLGRLDRPDLDRRPYVRALDAMGHEVARRAAAEQDGLARPMVLSQYLGNELGYVGSEVDFDHPDHIHLHRAIERKRGMPLTLTAIYLLVARRAGLSAAPLALPGRVMLRLYAGRRSLIIDPFDGGRARSRMDCIRYLANHGLVPRPDWFHDASDEVLFRRHSLNLMHSAQVRGQVNRTRELHALARILGRSQDVARHG